jgi:hypothetical protein
MRMLPSPGLRHLRGRRAPRLKGRRQRRAGRNPAGRPALQHVDLKRSGVVFQREDYRLDSASAACRRARRSVQPRRRKRALTKKQIDEGI